MHLYRSELNLNLLIDAIDVADANVYLDNDVKTFASIVKKQGDWISILNMLFYLFLLTLWFHRI